MWNLFIQSKMSQFQQLDIEQLIHNEMFKTSPVLCYFKQKEFKVPMSDLTYEKIIEIQKELIKKSQRPKIGTPLVKKNWRQEQLQFLFFILDKVCLTLDSPLEMLNQKHWEKIALVLPGRQETDCKYKALSLKRYSLSEFPWSQQQQRTFVRIVEEEGLRWDKVSKKLHEQARNRERKIFRNSKQCRQHYLCFLNPNMKKGPWNTEEDYKLVSLYLKFGRKWSLMSRAIKGRNQNAIKNRFFLLVQNKFKTMKGAKHLYDQYMEQAERLKIAFQAKIGRQKYQALKEQLEQQVLQSQQKFKMEQFQQITPKKQQKSIKLQPQSSQKFKQQQKQLIIRQVNSPNFMQNYQIQLNTPKMQNENRQHNFMGSQQFLDFLNF